MSLRPTTKLVFDFIFDKACPAGIWRVNLRAAEVLTGVKPIVWLPLIRELNQPPPGYPGFLPPIRILTGGRLWIIPYLRWRRRNPTVLNPTPSNKCAVWNLMNAGLWESWAEMYPEMLPAGCGPNHPPDWAVGGRLKRERKAPLMDRLKALPETRGLNQAELADLLAYARSPSRKKLRGNLPKMVRNWVAATTREERLNLQARLARIGRSVKALQGKTYLPPGAQFPKLLPEAAETLKQLSEERKQIHARIDEIKKRTHSQRSLGVFEALAEAEGGQRPSLPATEGGDGLRAGESCGGGDVHLV